MLSLRQVRLEITTNSSAEGEEDSSAGGEEDGPDFIGRTTQKVAAGEASFTDLVVDWNKPLRPGGEQASVEAKLLLGSKGGLEQSKP